MTDLRIYHGFFVKSHHFVRRNELEALHHLQQSQEWSMLN